MTEEIYKIARFQFCFLWVSTFSTPFLWTWLWGSIVPNESQGHIPVFVVFSVGVIIAFGLHFVLRKLLRKSYLVGTAIYTMYQRERKLESETRIKG